MVGFQAHAAARCAMVGTEAMGFFNLAVYGLQAVWYPAFTIALTAQGRGGHASPRYLRATPGLAWRSEGCNSCNRAEEPQARSNSSRHAWESLATLARAPSRNSTPSAMFPLPKAGDAALRALSTLAAEAPLKVRVPNLRIRGANGGTLEYTLNRGSHRAPFFY